jgi:predicted aspartyl protease
MTGLVNGERGMGRFAVDIDIANFLDVAEWRAGKLDQDRVRRTRIQGIVDPGAARLVLPKKVVDDLGLPVVGTTTVRYADGRTAERDMVETAYIEIQGRSGAFRASVEPDRTTALIGALVLEDFDFLVDCSHQKLVPRDPKGIISEIE